MKVLRLLRIATLPAVSVLALTAAGQPTYAAQPVAAGRLASTVIASDPFTNSSSMHATVVEPGSFAWGATIVDAQQEGRFTDGGASGIGWATSADGGATWTHGVLSGLTKFKGGGKYSRATDAVVAYDAKHSTWLISTDALMNTSSTPRGTGVEVYRSANGTSWTGPVAAIDGSTTSTNNYDKDWIVCDNTTTSPHYGTCYATVDIFSSSNQLVFASSTDGGTTWSKPVQPSGATGALIGGMVVQPDGTVVAVYDRVIGGNNQMATESSDGGATWTKPVSISTIQWHQPAGSLRGDPLVSVTIDQAGQIYAAWPDCRFRSGCPENDIVYSTSANGTTWTSPARIPIDPVTSTVEHYIPVIVANPATSGPTGHVAVYYYYYPNANCGFGTTCTIGAGISTSTNGGSTWTAGKSLVAPFPVTLLPDTSSGYMVGDYIGAAISGGKSFGTLIIAKKATPGKAYNVALYSDAGQSLAAGRYPAQTATPASAGQTASGAKQDPAAN